MKRIRIVLADDHTVVRNGLRLILEGSPILRWWEKHLTAARSCGWLKRKEPDVVVMDIGTPGLNGMEAARRVVEDFPGTKVAILNMHKDEGVT